MLRAFAVKQLNTLDPSKEVNRNMVSSLLLTKTLLKFLLQVLAFLFLERKTSHRASEEDDGSTSRGQADTMSVCSARVCAVCLSSPSVVADSTRAENFSGARDYHRNSHA